MKDELREELKKRGTAEIAANGAVLQVTQALDEKDGIAKFLICGEPQEQKYIPIDEACGKCSSWQGRFANTKMCQEYQVKGARARGFSEIICPNQFIKTKNKYRREPTRQKQETTNRTQEASHSM